MLTWSVLTLLALILTVISLWRVNLLMSTVAAAVWFGALAYHLIDRPTGIVAGDSADVSIILAFVGVPLALWFFTLMRTKMRRGGALGNFTGSMEGDERRDDMMSNPEQEYRDRVRRAVRPNRRRR